MAEDSRAKVLALVELAVGRTTPPHEARAAAMAACKRIKESGLLLEGPRGLAGAEDVVVVTIPFLVLNDTSKVFRVARLEPPRRSSSHVLLIPKEYVRKVVFMDLDECRAVGWKGSSVIKSLTLVKSYFDTARQSGWDDWS